MLAALTYRAETLRKNLHIKKVHPYVGSTLLLINYNQFTTLNASAAAGLVLVMVLLVLVLLLLLLVVVLLALGGSGTDGSGDASIRFGSGCSHTSQRFSRVTSECALAFTYKCWCRKQQ